MTHRIGLLLVLATFATACGAAGLHSSDARDELRDCRRLSDVNACIAVGTRHVEGDEADRDLERAAELFTRACRDDRRVGCYHLGMLGVMEADSEMPVADVVEGLERSCRRYNIGSCDALIMVLESPDSSEHDPDYADRIRARLCEDGFDYFCFRDSDGDGLNDDVDQCPLEPEDMDGFEDEDGCPEPDNDEDGILDADDACPLEAEDMDAFQNDDGCPDPDNDEDGVLDVDDACPDIAEDMDGFEDEDGCVDFDNDRDGILDGDDGCPDEAEDYDGFEDADGCPEEGEGLVQLTCDAIVISDKVYFDSNSDVIQERSFALLDQVASVLSSVSYINSVEIAGHTDDRGRDELNLDLSDRRANSVMVYLVDAGVDMERLQAAGYGESNPIADNGSSSGRAENRRVEFNILSQDTTNCGQ